MKFPSTTVAGPWVRIDGRSGQFIVSTPEGETDYVDPKDKVIGVDLQNARQGWLHIDQGIFDWAPLENEDDWGTPPSEHHKPGVQCNLVGTNGIFGDSPVRSCTASTKAWTTFIGSVHEKCANDLSPDTIPTIKITAVRPVKIGKGNSINIAFDVAPTNRWIKRADLPTGDEATSDSDDSWG
jgi:hypothetical protein